MRSIRLHSASPQFRTACALLLAAVLTGCQSLTSASSHETRVRIVDLSPDFGPLDIYQGNAALAHNLSYGSVTSYIRLPSAGLTLTVAPAGSHQVLSTIRMPPANGIPSTLLLLHSPASVQVEVLLDQAAAPASDASFVRVVNRTGRSGPLDVYLVPPATHTSSLSPIAVNLVSGGSTGYTAVPAGVGSIAVLPAGTRASSSAFSAHTGPQSDYAPASARTIILVDGESQESLPSVVAIPLLDAEPGN